MREPGTGWSGPEFEMSLASPKQDHFLGGGGDNWQTCEFVFTKLDLKNLFKPSQRGEDQREEKRRAEDQRGEERRGGERRGVH